MKNKIKYLLGLFIVGFGLLFNQGFCFLYDIELVATQFRFSPDFSISFSNLFRADVSSNSEGVGSPLTIYSVPFFGYGLYDNNILSVDRFNRVYTYAESNQSSNCYRSVFFNTSLYGLDVRTGVCELAYAQRYYPSNFGPMKYTTSTWPSSSLQFDFGESNLSGFGFIEPVFTNITPTKRPVYSFGNGFFTGNNYFTYNSSDFPKGARILYNTTGSNVLNNIDFVGPTENQPSIYAWELFGFNNTLTNFGYIVDSNGIKGKHFGLFGFGYSFAYNKNTSNSSRVSRNDFGFFTVFDRSIDLVKGLGGIDFIATDSDQSYHNNGIMVLKKNQFSSTYNDGVVLISKNPSNTKQLLFQEFNCRTSNIPCLMNGGPYCGYDDGVYNNSGFKCLVTSQGLLSYSGSTDVLPFSNRSSYYTGSSSPVLSYFLYGNNLGDVWTNGNSYCFGSTPGVSQICLDKVIGNQSIKESYLNGDFYNPYEDISYGTVNSGLISLCKTNAYFAVVNYDVCQGLNPSDIVSVSGSDYVITYVDYGSGNVVQKLIPRPDYEDGGGTDSDGNSYVVCSSSHPCTSNNEGSSYFSSGILSLDYYDFNNTGLFFKCPYPYNSLLNLYDWNLNIAGFDILGPINCMIAAFQHGKSFDAFDNVGLFGFGPLITGDTQQHRILFRFFDMLLVLGLVLFFSLIYKRFK